jgi:glycosyltransferase involved in cell wall biosynthesis
MARVPLTIIIPTYNEEVNLPHALDSVAGWADQVIVLDSFSTDATVKAAEERGAEVHVHRYENMAAQRMRGLGLPSVRNDWVFNLDADEQLTDGLKAEIAEAIGSAESGVAGFMMRRDHIFMGRGLKYGGDRIWLIRLVRKDRCRVVKTPYVNEHTIVNGAVVKLSNTFTHMSRKPFTKWIERQNRGSLKYTYSILKHTGTARPALNHGERIEGGVRTWLNYGVYYRAPLALRPFMRFFVFYFLRGGFLDGWQGFVYHTVNDFIYPFFVYANYRELKLSEEARKNAETSGWR